jgi:hypothetical protein
VGEQGKLSCAGEEKKKHCAWRGNYTGPRNISTVIFYTGKIKIYLAWQ